MEQAREESQIFEDLAVLAASPGYVHAVAHICHRDNVIHIKGKLKPSDTRLIDLSEHARYVTR